MYVNDQLVLDNGFKTRQTPGDSFYGNGTVEEVGVYELKKGERYKIVLEYSNMPGDAEIQDDSPAKGVRGLMVAAVRLSCAPKLSGEDDAICQAVDITKDADAVLCFTGSTMDWETEGADRTRFLLPGATNKLVEALLEVRPDTVICNQSVSSASVMLFHADPSQGSAWAFPWLDKADTILQSWFGGDETGNAIADVIFGDVTPGGRMPLSFPYEIEHCTGHLNWGSENGKVLYGEGLFVSPGMIPSVAARLTLCRSVTEDTKRQSAMSCLPLARASATPRSVCPPSVDESSADGFTEWVGPKADTTQGTSADDVKVTLSLTVNNTGNRPGSEVVQVYVHDPISKLRRPQKELKGFAKVVLDPGASQDVSIVLDKYAFSYWDDKAGCWVLEAGDFELIVAKSSRAKDEVARLRVTLKNTHHWSGL